MANQTVLDLVKSFCREYALPVPSGLQGSSDAGALQMRELLITVGENILAQSNWQECSRRVVWSSLSGEDQGDIDALFPEDFAGIVPQTFWDLTQRLPLTGPVNDVNWQSRQALNPSGPVYAYKVSGNRLLTTASMPAGHQLSLYYKTRRWIRSGTVTQTQFTADTDTSVFPDTLMKLGLRAFWLRIKQMPHRFEMEQFDDAVAREGSISSIKPILKLDASSDTSGYGIVIPNGNWTL
jgi:hypothetical protein